MDLSISGLASGMNWKSIVSQLAEVERAPEKLLQTEQSTINTRNKAYADINTDLSTLQTKNASLKDASLFTKRTAESSDSAVATATAGDGTALGSYVIQVSQLAKAATYKGAGGLSSPISSSSDVSAVILGTAGFGSDFKEGNFTINGKQISLKSTDTLQSVFDQISTVTDGSVTAAYDSTTDKITLTSSSNIVLGSAADTSNFLQLTNLNGNSSTSITSSAVLGGINLNRALSTANFTTAINDGGSGEFTINGVSITYSSSQTVADVIKSINNSSAGVSAAFDASNGQFVLTNKTTGDVGITVQDVKGNFVTASGLKSGTLTNGQNLIYTINGGGELVSQSNTISDTSSGIAGLSVTALKTGSSTVTISTDTTQIEQAIKDFVTEYNAVQGKIDTYTASSTDSSGKVTAGVLAGESDASDIATSLRKITYNPSTSSTGLIKSLDDLGITTGGTDNNLTITDETKLTDALKNNLEAVQNLFSNSTSGLSVKLADYFDKTIGDDGTLVTKQSNLTKQADDINTQIADQEKRVQDYIDQMNSEFIAMETAQQNYKSQLQYLQQNFGGGSSSASVSSGYSSATSSSSSSSS